MNSPSGQKGDDVVLGTLDGSISSIRRSAVEAAIAFSPPAQTAAAASFGITPSSACASQAWASISNQMRKRFSGAQMAPFAAANSV